MSRIYPSLEERRATTGASAPAAVRLEPEQIIQRASSINKDLINRMQNSQIGKTYKRGIRTKQFWVLTALSILLTISTVSIVLIWFTASFDNFVLKHLTIAPGTDMERDFVKPGYKTHLIVYMFNYTNVDRYEKRLDPRLIVKEVGPYHYEETKERIDATYGDGGGTVTYRERLTHRFVPSKSGGRQNDMVIVPNLVTFGAVKRTEKSVFLTKFAASLTMGKPFMRQPVHRFLWGYDDAGYNLVKGMLRMQNPNVHDDMGLLANRDGLIPRMMTLPTGKNGFDDFGVFRELDGSDRLGFWSTEECDSVRGSEGGLNPPYEVRAKRPLRLFIADTCRSYPYVFDVEHKIINGTVPAYRYVMPSNVYDDPYGNVENQCYCNLNTGECPPQGFYDMSQCALDTPLYLSMPHMYNVDESYVKVDGQTPNYRRSESYLNVHPTMGFGMTASYRFQANVLAKRPLGFTSMSIFREETMLPIAWADVGVTEDELDQAAIDTIYRSTFTARYLELSIKYVSVSVFAVALSAICIILKARYDERRRRNVVV